ncbi:MAG: 3-hydroxyacyl-CoA dehydrogenase/enoyl-CoA hydratase family protein [Alphaproteobacteria bacterium]|nr:3-hydroxyacyl-CoA dehydrogenase/enoyl-CoA hydratase family protein [Alphaproteobacteria bacterium]
MSEINKVAVIGAGVMGAAIAAHIANAGHEVMLLDIVPESGRRNALAEGAVERMLKTDPAPFMAKSFAKRIVCGNLEDDLKRLKDADWIIEAVTERLEIKRAVYQKIEGARRDGSIVSSNTSTIRLRTLIEGQPERFARDFMITHFFNPPRYMRLLELVPGPATRKDAIETVRRFCDVALGKGVIEANDTPGFIANRIGTFWIQCALNEALDHGIPVEEADAVLSRPFGIPKTGVFALMDLVGIDLMPLVGRSLAGAVPEGDGFRAIHREPDALKRMIADGLTGRKGKGGFYRLAEIDGKRVKQVIDLKALQYAPARRVRLDSIEASKGGNLRALLEHKDRSGTFAWRVMSKTLAYAASLVPEIAHSPQAVDDAMRLGYNWTRGPFELIDRIGAGWFADKLKADGSAVPPLLAQAAQAGGFYKTEGGKRTVLWPAGAYRPVERGQGVLLLADVKLAGKPLARNGSASLWDVGDGVAALEFHTKMNALDADSLALAARSIDIVRERFKALVIYNEGENFSAGVNLGLALFAVNLAAWPLIEDLVKKGQDTFHALKYAPFPVVGAPSGLALGGGCEVLLHCDAVQAHAESYIGLVEVGVGLIPGWGGCRAMLARGLSQKRGFGGAMPAISKVFETIGTAKVSRSAYEALELGYLREGDGITANRDRLLADAKAKALSLVAGHKPPEPPTYKLPGKTARIALALAVKGFALTGKITAHDQIVVKELANILSGGETDTPDQISDDALARLEREAFMRLIREPKTLARMEHMLATGKPLRN